LRAVLDHRLAIETGVAIRAAERAEESDLDTLIEFTDEMDDAKEFETYRQADLRFHMSLAEAAHSPRLMEAMAEVQSDLDEVIELVPHPQEVLQRSNDQHRELINLLRKGDADGAAKLIREHVEGTEYFLAGMLPDPNTT
jgi:DNA-binding FadR family transcriptional regulator